MQKDEIESRWFKVSVGAQADRLVEFAVRAGSEDFAVSALREYCDHAVPGLGTSPSDVMPWGIVVKLLDIFDADHHRALENTSPDVKLVNDARPLPMPSADESQSRQANPNHPALFVTDRWGRNKKYVKWWDDSPGHAD